MSLPRLFVSGVLFALLLTASASSAQPLRSCGSGVRAAIVDCGKAKRIAREFRKTGRRSIWMYTCRPGERRHRCVLDRKIVTFPAG
jgi:hypothetical protein